MGTSRSAGEFTVLLTACIAPKVGIREHLRRADPVARERDYAEALRFWLELNEPRIGGIVFADNSGQSLDKLRQIARHCSAGRRPVEFLSWDFPPPRMDLSYGHSEFLLVNKAVEASELIHGSRYFIKATGRYRFPAIQRLLRRLPADFHVAVDSKGFRPFGLKSQPMSPVALALFDREYYTQHLAQLPAAMVPAPPWDRRQFVETVLFDQLYPQRADPRLILRWPCNCEPLGIGANGDNYSSRGKAVQRLLRAVSRRLWPSLWI